ncbi:class I SAM-dependent methyltransferase [Variovorax sp. CF313]|uniref:class I SAM-dependent methyltransferase n=1 Tax=Variovorax sp. CF313 TaxID=1144315 RepID=UPI002351C707|nr:class I SAM-dependent methyltransferase [Variovorax sp. CF313]
MAARAEASRLRGDAQAFSDPEAQRIAASLPFDLSAYAMDAAFVRSVVLRAALFDRFAAEFLAIHPGGLCITLGAGLCTRRSRLGAAVAAGSRWLNIDLPDAIGLRAQHMARGEGETDLACSILDDAWLDAAGLPGERPVLAMLEGVCPYLPQAPLEALLCRLAGRFEHGATPCTVVLDHVHPVLARQPMAVGGMRLPVVSGFEDAVQIARLHPSMRVLSEDHIYAQFSEQHRLFEAAFQAATGAWPYAVVRLALGPQDDA